MAGAIEQGGFSEEPDKKDLDLNSPAIVKIDTDAFSGEAISLYDMPGDRVLGVFSAPGAGQLPRMVELLRLSLNDPLKADYLSILSFRELSEVVAQWISKSESDSIQVSFGLFD